jgi:hypothetical protein
LLFGLGDLTHAFGERLSGGLSPQASALDPAPQLIDIDA